jgi:hypothetical protein
VGAYSFDSASSRHGAERQGGQIWRRHGRTQAMWEEGDDKRGPLVRKARRGAQAAQSGGTFLQWWRKLGRALAEYMSLLGRVRMAVAREGVGWRSGLARLG